MWVSVLTTGIRILDLKVCFHLIEDLSLPHTLLLKGKLNTSVLNYTTTCFLHLMVDQITWMTLTTVAPLDLVP